MREQQAGSAARATRAAERAARRPCETRAQGAWRRSGDRSGYAAPARGDSGFGVGCASDKNGRGECAAPTRDESVGCASDTSGGVGGAAPTRDERPGQRAPEQRSCGADARGQQDRKRGPREAGAWSAPEKRTFRSCSLMGFDLRQDSSRAVQRFARLCSLARAPRGRRSLRSSPGGARGASVTASPLCSLSKRRVHARF